MSSDHGHGDAHGHGDGHGEDDGRIAQIRGIGGELILYADHVRILRHGVWFTAVNLFEHVEREVETVIHLRDIVGIHLLRSLLLVQFLRFSYAGCPMPSGHYLRDAFAENAFLYSLFDNRPLLGFMHRVSRAVIAQRRRDPLGDWI
jgi:hypothetical protein